jgi:hypothetical protein
MYIYCMKNAKTVHRKNKHAQALGRLGGLKGGKARAAALRPEERSAIARKAVMTRWEKARKEKEEGVGKE